MLKRFGYFVFGIAAYLIFLATFLYAIVFVGGIGIRNWLDGPLSGSAIIAVTIDLFLLLVFAVQHSVMARPWFKERWTQIVPWAIERSTYVLCASLALLLLFWQWRPLGGEIWTVENPIGRGLLWIIFGLGWTTVLCVTFLISHFVVRSAAGLDATHWQGLYPRPVSNPAAVSPDSPPVVLRLFARLLEHSNYDGGAPTLCVGNNGLHHSCHPI
jgi:protein-S-isoprenylcysteine O-methyltransferase Ste14